MRAMKYIPCPNCDDGYVPRDRDPQDVILCDVCGGRKEIPEDEKGFPLEWIRLCRAVDKWSREEFD